jgi:hypothetical protein
MHNVSQSYYGTPSAPLNTTFFAILGPMSPTLPAAAMQAAVAQGAAQGYQVVFVNASAACGSDLTGCRDGCAGAFAERAGGARLCALFTRQAQSTIAPPKNTLPTQTNRAPWRGQPPQHCANSGHRDRGGAGLAIAGRLVSKYLGARALKKKGERNLT